MKVQDVMTRDVQVARPDEPIQSVARRMSEGDFGFMPVCDGHRLEGTVTDRDLTTRALAEGKSFETPVAAVMSRGVQCCRADDDAKAVLKQMGDKQIRRMPIVDDDDRLIGVVAIGDLAGAVRDKHSGDALEEISEPASR